MRTVLRDLKNQSLVITNHGHSLLHNDTLVNNDEA
jgi:hypothetical protein